MTPDKPLPSIDPLGPKPADIVDEVDDQLDRADREESAKPRVLVRRDSYRLSVVPRNSA